MSCYWQVDWALAVGTFFSFFSFSINIVRYGPVAWINQEALLEEKKENDDEDDVGDDGVKVKTKSSVDQTPALPYYSLAIPKSRLGLCKILIYFFGLFSNICGCVGFLVLLITWTFMTYHIFFFLLPLLLLQISQPNWLAYMWHRIRRRDHAQTGVVAHHRGVWWRLFLTASPVTFTAVTTILGVPLLLKYQDSEVMSDGRPIIWFERGGKTMDNKKSFNSSSSSSFPTLSSSNCTFTILHMESWDEEKWLLAISKQYGCSVDPDLRKRNDSLPTLEIGNFSITSAGTIFHCSIRAAAVMLGVCYNLLQMWIFRKPGKRRKKKKEKEKSSKRFAKRLVVWPLLLALIAVMGEVLIAYSNYKDLDSETVTFNAWVFTQAFCFFTILLSALSLPCRKCCKCCCQPCCDE